MDKHDVAHYGIAGAVGAALVGLYSVMPTEQPAWPSLTKQEAADVVSAIGSASPKFGVYCADEACTKIARSLVKAGKAKGFTVDYEVPLTSMNNLQVGAPTEAEANKIKAAVEKASDGKLKVDTVFAQGQLYYISFGHIAKDE